VQYSALQYLLFKDGPEMRALLRHIFFSEFVAVEIVAESDKEKILFRNRYRRR
jgi:hypothetical protein